MGRLLSAIVWIGVAALGAAGFGVIALSRGETISAAWILIAGVCTYLVAYGSTGDSSRRRSSRSTPPAATPAERLNNGRDFHPTNRWIAYGHHFAAISGAGPLIGPTLAAQFGFLPGTLWLILGVVLGGAVQDFTILVASIRRDGKSLGQMAKEEVNPLAGLAAMVAILAIMIILLAVLALVVVNALRGSPWGLFTIATHDPDCVPDGLVDEARPAGQGRRDLAHRRRAADVRPGRRAVGVAASGLGGGVHLVGHADLLGDHRLRVRRVGAAGVDAAGAARLPVHVSQGRHARSCWPARSSS